MKIIRKSFKIKKLAFLISFALLSQGFCTNTFAGTTSEETVCYVQENIAGNAGYVNYSPEGEKVAYNAPTAYAHSSAEGLINTDKLASDTRSDSVLSNNSIPNSEERSCGIASTYTYYEEVHCTYSDAISETKFENTTLLDDDTTSGSALSAETAAGTGDEISSGSSAIIDPDNTNSEKNNSDEDQNGAVKSYDEETQTTTEDGRSSRKASLGGGNSSSKAERRGNSDNNGPNKRPNDDDGAHQPDNRSTDTPDASLNESNDANKNADAENENNNGNGTNGSDTDKNKDTVLTTSSDPDTNGDPNSDNMNDPSNLGKDSNNSPNYGNDPNNSGTTGSGTSVGSQSGNTLPQTGSAANTDTVTLCGLALALFGAALIKKTKRCVKHC